MMSLLAFLAGFPFAVFAEFSPTALVGQVLPTDAHATLTEPSEDELLSIIDSPIDAVRYDRGTLGMAQPNSIQIGGGESKAASKPAHQENHTSVAVPAVDKDSGFVPPEAHGFEVVRKGYCAVNNAWTPGDHGCAYVNTAEDCATAAKALGVQTSIQDVLSRPVNKAILMAVPAFLIPRANMASRQPRGCLMAAQKEGAQIQNAKVVFAGGYGSSPCGEDGQDCICDCRNRRHAATDEDLPEPDQIAFLAAGTFIFITMVFLKGNMHWRVMWGSQAFLFVSMI